jgi:E3 ubiquitin-protein ligase UBR7
LQDWLHESCLNLVVPEPATTLTGTNAPGNDDDDDEEKEVLIPSETYDGLICASCVSGNAYLQENAGQPGWMIIEPSENGVHQVLGRERPLESDAHGSRVAAGKDEEAASGAAADVPTGENEVSHKRPAESDDGGTMATKRLRLDTSNTPDKPATHSPQRKGKGDVFLAHGVRTALKDRLPVSLDPN